MMRRLTLFLEISIYSAVSLLLLASCQESRTVNQVSLTPYNTEDFESISKNPNILIDLPGITPIPENLVAPRPHITSTQSVKDKSDVYIINPTPTFQIPIPEIQGGTYQYSIASASVETLIKLQLYRTSQGVITESPIDDLLYPTFHDVLDYEWESAYAQRVYSPELIAHIPNFFDHSRGRLTNKMLIDLLGDHIAWLLNENDVNLTGKEHYEIENFTGRVYQVEIDNDSTPEWLIEVRDTEGFYLSRYSFWITLNQIEDFRYARLDNQIPWIWGRSVIPDHPINFRDFTGDGIMDFVVIDLNCRVGFCDGEIHIAAGNIDGYKLLPSSINFTDDSDGTAKNITDLHWSISPRNNLPVLKLTTYKDLGWDCAVAKTQEIQWENNTEHVSIGPPEYYYKLNNSEKIQENSINNTMLPRCAIARAMLPENLQKIDHQIKLLESTLIYFDQLLPEERFYVLFRLSILSASQKDFENAGMYLEQIEATINNSTSPIAMALMDEVEMALSVGIINPFELCLAAEEIIWAWSTSKENQLNTEKTFPDPSYPFIYSNQLCESRVILFEMLKSLKVEDYHSLDKAIHGAGIKDTMVIPIFVKKPDSGWLVVINGNNLEGTNHATESKGGSLYVYLYSETEGWIDLYFTPSATTPSYNIRDISGDGIMDFTLVTPGTNPETSNCYSMDQPMEIFLITALTDEWLVSYSETLCLEPGTSLDFSNYLVDSDQNGIMDVVQFYFEENLFDLTLFENIETEPNWEFVSPPYYRLATLINKDVILSAIAEEIISSKSKFDTFQELERLQVIWGNDDPLGRYIRAQTNYLLALSYEQDGEFSKAADLFIEIWKNQSDTIWGNLASSRLTKEN
jgi:hypothetical protein